MRLSISRARRLSEKLVKPTIIRLRRVEKLEIANIITMTDNIRFYLVSGYAGKPEAGIEIDGAQYRIDSEYLKAYIEKAVIKKGFVVSQTKRQKYPRVTIKD